MISVKVLPRIAVEGKDVGDALVISIVSPGVVHPEIKGSRVYKFHFHDVTEEYFLEHTNQVIRPMEKEIAESIVEIAMRNRECKQWIIHCEAGISRSPGVAIGLASGIDLQPDMRTLMKMYPLYNKHVCKWVCKYVRDKIDEIEKELAFVKYIDKEK